MLRLVSLTRQAAQAAECPPAEHHRPNQRAPPIDDDDDLSKACFAQWHQLASTAIAPP